MKQLLIILFALFMIFCARQCDNEKTETLDNHSLFCPTERLNGYVQQRVTIGSMLDRHTILTLCQRMYLDV